MGAARYRQNYAGANIAETGAEFIELNAVTAGKADVVKTVERAEQNRRPGLTTILFCGSIHRFNKAQDAFLQRRDGTIILISHHREPQL